MPAGSNQILISLAHDFSLGMILFHSCPSLSIEVGLVLALAPGVTDDECSCFWCTADRCGQGREEDGKT